MSAEIENLEIELFAICEKHGWKVIRTAMADSTNSRYYTVDKNLGLFDADENELYISADVRLSDHENQSRTAWHGNKLFNIAGGHSATLEKFERSLLRASVVDADEARTAGEVTDDNISWK